MADDIVDKVVVNKSKRELLLYRRGEVVHAYKVALGRNPTGPKRQEGDGRTPEGAYIISGRNPASAFHLACVFLIQTQPIAPAANGTEWIPAATS